MILSLIFLMVSTTIVFAQTPTAVAPTTPHWIDPSIGGKSGNPGARIRLSNKTIDDVHVYAAAAIAKIIKNLTIPDFHIPIGAGLLTIKPPQINDVKFPNVDNELVSPARIYSRFYGGQISATGSWSFKPYNRRIDPASGTYRASITNAQINTTSRFGRTNDGKPTIQTIACKSYLGDFNANVNSAENVTTDARALVQTCDNPICVKIRQFFEEIVCLAVRTFVKDGINAELSTYPNRVIIRNDNYKLDYGLINNEPRISNGYLQAGSEGKFIWRQSSNVPFSPSPLNFVDHSAALAFEISDFTFNTLLQQAHGHGYLHSAAHMYEHGSIPVDKLRLNCSNAKPRELSRKTSRNNLKSDQSSTQHIFQCLGQLFENITGIVDQFPSNSTGDLVFKSTQKSPSVFVQSAGNGFFDGGVGTLEIQGPVGQNKQRQVLARADVRSMRGQFFPKFLNGNFTGAVTITSLELDNAAIGAQQSRAIGFGRMDAADFTIQLEEFAVPILTQIFTEFIKLQGQFPIPMLAGFECTSPQFTISPRTLQVDCNVQRATRPTPQRP